MNGPENDEAEDSIGRPSKRQQGDTPYLSPNASGSDAGGIRLEDTVRYLFHKKNLMTSNFKNRLPNLNSYRRHGRHLSNKA